jgi:hypothetical protein
MNESEVEITTYNLNLENKIINRRRSTGRVEVSHCLSHWDECFPTAGFWHIWLFVYSDERKFKNYLIISSSLLWPYALHWYIFFGRHWLPVDIRACCCTFWDIHSSMSCVECLCGRWASHHKIRGLLRCIILLYTVIWNGLVWTIRHLRLII